MTAPMLLPGETFAPCVGRFLVHRRGGAGVRPTFATRGRIRENRVQMEGETGRPSSGGVSSTALMRDTRHDYHRLHRVLAARARWLGSRDCESAAQETLARSLRNPTPQAAIEYYFSDDLPPDQPAPEWPLDQLLAWLHGVLTFVVREEHNRASSRREVLLGGADSESSLRLMGSLDRADPAPDQLDMLIQKEMQQIVVECLPALEPEYRTVLKMRAEGLKYEEIAVRLGTNENTVATWVSRGIKTLAQRVRRRTQLGTKTNG
jgi:RNA polymerase sigma factor (sigma-70 family)